MKLFRNGKFSSIRKFKKRADLYVRSINQNRDTRFWLFEIFFRIWNIIIAAFFRVVWDTSFLTYTKTALNEIFKTNEDLCHVLQSIRQRTQLCKVVFVIQFPFRNNTFMAKISCHFRLQWIQKVFERLFTVYFRNYKIVHRTTNNCWQQSRQYY